MGDIMELFEKERTVSELVLACYVAPRTAKLVHTDRKSHGVALHISGKRIYHFSDSKDLFVEKNDIIFLPEHSTYTVETVEEGACYAINFRFTENVSLCPFVQHIQNSAGILEHFKTADRSYISKKSGYAWQCLSELYAVLYEMKRERSKLYIASKDKQTLLPAVEYMHDHFADKAVSVDELASLCHISTVYFRRLFGLCFGISPIKYLQNLRLVYAKDLILSDQYTVEETANLSGFGDESYFCRFFKKETGMTPSEYRKNFQ